MNKVAINLTEIEIKDLNEVVYQVDDLHKKVGNTVFTGAESIEVSDIARILHKGESAEVTSIELEDIIRIVRMNPQYKPFAQSQIIEYLTNKLDNLNNNQDGNTEEQG